MRWVIRVPKRVSRSCRALAGLTKAGFCNICADPPPEFRADSGIERFEQFSLDSDLRLVVLQLWSVDQEGIFHPLAQRADLGQLQIDAVTCQHPRDAVEQTCTVAG